MSKTLSFMWGAIEQPQALWRDFGATEVQKQFVPNTSGFRERPKHESRAKKQDSDWKSLKFVTNMSFAGKYKYQHRHKNTDNYEEFLRLMSVPWLRRKLDPFLCPHLIITTDSTGGTLRFCSDYCAEKVIVLGEEHTETLPNGEKATAVTVREGDNCLITRLKSPWNMEMRREFSSKGICSKFAIQRAV